MTGGFLQSMVAGNHPYLTRCRVLEQHFLDGRIGIAAGGCEDDNHSFDYHLPGDVRRSITRVEYDRRPLALLGREMVRQKDQ